MVGCATVDREFEVTRASGLASVAKSSVLLSRVAVEVGIATVVLDDKAVVGGDVAVEVVEIIVGLGVVKIAGSGGNNTCNKCKTNEWCVKHAHTALQITNILCLNVHLATKKVNAGGPCYGVCYRHPA